MVRITQEPAIQDNVLTDKTRLEVGKYAAIAIKAQMLPIFDDGQRLYAVIIVPDRPRPFPARVVVMAQVVSDKVIIIEDTTDKPLVEALMQAGIPREQIVLAYAGESVPTENTD